MRLYIPNGSVASGRFISPRRRRRGGKIPQPRRGWFFRPGAGEGGAADRPGIIFPGATDKAIVSIYFLS